MTRSLEQHVFDGFRLETEHAEYQSRIVLRRRTGPSLPFLVWSAGQREFVPLLMGLYPLLPPSVLPRVGTVRWVVIEDPEIGLNPNGIAAVLNRVAVAGERLPSVHLHSLAARTRHRVGAPLLPASWRAAGRRSGTPRFEAERGDAGTRRVGTGAQSPGLLLLPGRSRTGHATT